MGLDLNEFLLTKSLTEATGLGGIVNDGLVLHLDAGYRHSYPTGGTVWYDLSGNGNNGTLVNGPSFSVENKGNIVFDGSNDEVKNFPFQLPNSGSKSIFVWFIVYLTSRRGLIGTRPLNTLQQGWGFTVNRTTPGNLTLFHTGGSLIEVPAGIQTGTWYQACFVHDTSTATVKLYVNGVQVGSTATSFSVPSASPSNGVIGNEQEGGTGQIFNGRIASVLAYNRPLSDTEVLQNYNATKNRYNTLPPSPLDITVDYLIVGGGGGGGDRHGGGGGAGGYLSSSTIFGAGTPYTVTIGAGGAGGDHGAANSSPRGSGLRGSDSSISTIATAYGGGGGGTYDGNPSGTFGSGGGGGGRNLAGISGTSGQGNSGGTGALPGGGGGGGAGAAGGNANNGSGGAGSQWLDGNYYAGGGGGAWGTSSGPTTPGGVGGGGAGDWNDANIESGASNTGGGGGASRSDTASATGRPGGSGIVKLRYPSTNNITVGAGLTSNTVTSGNYKFTTITAGTGTITFS